VSYARVHGAPDIAVEMISPSERTSEAQRKVDEVISPAERAYDTQQKLDDYLHYGTKEVWQVYPKSRSTMVYRGARKTKVTTGEQLITPPLPGFSLAVESLF